MDIHKGTRHFTISKDYPFLTELEVEQYLALAQLKKLVVDMMPGVQHIALPDYALLNDGQIAAGKALARTKQILYIQNGGQ